MKYLVRVAGSSAILAVAGGELKIAESDFLKAHAESWTARQAPEFSVVNIHAMEISANRSQSFQPGQYFAFFCVRHVDAPREVGMEVENRLTHAVTSWVLSEGSGGTMVFNVTYANFKGRRGRLYWRVIRPFHDGLIEASLRTLRQRVEMD